MNSPWIKAIRFLFVACGCSIALWSVSASWILEPLLGGSSGGSPLAYLITPFLAAGFAIPVAALFALLAYLPTTVLFHVRSHFRSPLLLRVLSVFLGLTLACVTGHIVGSSFASLGMPTAKEILFLSGSVQWSEYAMYSLTAFGSVAGGLLLTTWVITKLDRPRYRSGLNDRGQR